MERDHAKEKQKLVKDKDAGVFSRSVTPFLNCYIEGDCLIS